MEWILKKLASGDTSLKVKNLRLFQEHADKFLQRKLTLTREEYRNPNAPDHVQKVKLYFTYYNIACYSIEHSENPGFGGFLIPNLLHPNQEILKRAILKAMQGIPFTVNWDTRNDMFCVLPIFSKEYDVEIIKRGNMQQMSEADIEFQMEHLFEWVKGYLDLVSLILLDAKKES